MRVYVLTVLWCVFPDSFSKAQELKVDVNFPGDDYLQIYSPDVQHCQLACTRHPSCLFFTFLRPDWIKDSKTFHCYLKHTVTGSPSQVVALTGATSGFKLVHQGNKTETCLSSTYQDIDFTGSDYVQLTLNNSDDCQKQCTSDPDCAFFSFTTKTFPHAESRNKCFLKYRWTVPIPSVLIKTPGLVSGFSDSLYKTKEDCKEEIFANVHYRGNDIDNVPAASPQHCQFLCNTHPRCTHFTYTTSKYSTQPEINMHCFLKHTHNVSQLEPVKEEKLFSGFPTQNCTPSNVWATARYEGLHFLGHHYRDFKTDSSELCREMCTKDPNCHFYSYVLPSYRDKDIRNKCFLKYRWTVPIPSVLIKTPGLVSGFSDSLYKTKEDCKEEIFANVHYRGNDIDNVPAASPQHCQFLCNTHPRCTHFTYTTSKYSTQPEIKLHCFLKYTQDVSQLEPEREEELFSGFITRNCTPSNDCKEEIFANIHYRGDGIDKAPAASPQHCQFLCNTHPCCTHFTYTTSKYSTDPEINMHCYLKHSQNVSQLVPVSKDGIFSGFPTRNCTPSNVWATARYQGLHFLGHDYRDFKTDSTEICREMCTKDPNCHFYTYVLPSYRDENIRNKCFLKYRWTVPIPSVLIKTPGLVSGFSDSLYKTKEDCKEEIFANVHYRGNDIDNVPAASPQHCQFLCNTHPRCTHFTYTTSKYSTQPEIKLHCFLKYTQDVSRLEPEREEELFSGFITRNCTPSNVWATARYEGLHFLGHDYRDFKTDSSEICREMCTKDPNCHFYTYVPSSYHDKRIRRGCYLKHVMDLPIPEKVKYSHGVISGFSLRNCNESTAHLALLL